MVKEGMNFISDGIYDGIIKTKCCRKSYLRGAFLASGTVSNPEKGYHFELHTSTETQARDLRKRPQQFYGYQSADSCKKKRVRRISEGTGADPGCAGDHGSIQSVF